jgi:hypothetical protein
MLWFDLYVVKGTCFTVDDANTEAVVTLSFVVSFLSFLTWPSLLHQKLDLAA